LGIEAVNRQGFDLGPIDRGGAPTLPRESHDEPGRHRRNLGRSPLVARVELCGAMARLID
jgi:hypothetical protein